MKKFLLVSLLVVSVLIAAPSMARAADNSATIQALLQQIIALQTMLMNLLNQQKNVDSGDCFTFTNDLKLGDGLGIGGSKEVYQLQQILQNREGFAIADPSEINGRYFSHFTKRAVIRFQAKYGIDQTGYVGALTRAKLNELYGCSVVQGEFTVIAPDNHDAHKLGEEVSFEWLPTGVGVKQIELVPFGQKEFPNLETLVIYSKKALGDDPVYGGSVRIALPLGLSGLGHGQTALYHARMTTVDGITDLSDTPFQITNPSTSNNPSITVLSPNGGENYKVGDTVTIVWGAQNWEGYPVGIALYDKNNQFVKYIANSISVDRKGGYNWYIDGTIDGGKMASGQYKIHIYAEEKGGGEDDWSDDYFTISKNETPATTYIMDSTWVANTSECPAGFTRNGQILDYHSYGLRNCIVRGDSSKGIPGIEDIKMGPGKSTSVSLDQHTCPAGYRRSAVLLSGDRVNAHALCQKASLTPKVTELKFERVSGCTEGREAIATLASVDNTDWLLCVGREN